MNSTQVKEEEYINSSSAEETSENEEQVDEEVLEEEDQNEEDSNQALIVSQTTVHRTNPQSELICPVVRTRNIKKVEWPPKTGSAQVVSRIPANSKLKRNWKYPESNEKVSSYPFSKEGFSPNKLSVEAIWNPRDDVDSTPVHQVPKVSLRTTKEIMTHHDRATSFQSHYRMPPGTSRTRKCQENYEHVLEKEKKV